MSQIALLWVCLLAGIALKYWNRLPKEAPATFNGFIFYVSLPALILLKFHEVQFDLKSLIPISMPWLMFLLSVFTFYGLGKLFRLNRKTAGALVLTGGLGNTAFVGLPMIEAIYGKEALKTAILADQLGTFPVLSTLGMITASIYSSQNLTLKTVSKKVFSFPPLYALILGFLIRPVPFPEFMIDLLARLGATISPLALVSVGLQLNLSWNVLRSRFKVLSLGLLFKLLIAPLVFMGFYLICFGHLSAEIRVVIAQAAMAPMITAAVVASEYDLDPELANLMVGIGIPLSFLSVPVWVYFMS